MDWSPGNIGLLALGIIVLVLLWWLKRTNDRLRDLQQRHAHRAREAAELETRIQAIMGERVALGSTATCGLLVVDRQRRITWLNEAAQELFGTREALNRSLIEVVVSYEIAQVVQDAVERT